MKHLLNSITLLLLSTLAFGQVPNTFSSGETISSSKINANFSFLASAIKNDNITAMMVCRTSGKKNSENEFYYGLCSSTDDQSFNTVNGLTKSYINATAYRIDEKSIGDVPNSISNSELFSNGWILYDSINQFAIHSRGGGADNHNLYFFERYIFYKVSSD